MTTTNGPIFSNQRPATGGSAGGIVRGSAQAYSSSPPLPLSPPVAPRGLGRLVRGSLLAHPHPAALRRGFTLIELAVVFAVIAILVTVVAFTARGGRTSAKIKQTRATMDVLKLAMDEYRAARGAYPR
ncbi:MAG: prepilin-type N-terminal cleavage/methylation domain-containing protein, partial [Phycisphaerae bacterium]